MDIQPPSLIPKPRMTPLERQLWLSKVKAPEGMVLVDIRELGRMQQVVMTQGQQIETLIKTGNDTAALCKKMASIIQESLGIADPSRSIEYLREACARGD